MSEHLSDMASEREQIELDRAIEQFRRQRVAPAPPSNECWNLCGTPPAAGSRYCSSECLADHERATEMKKRQGRA